MEADGGPAEQQQLLPTTSPTHQLTIELTTTLTSHSIATQVNECLHRTQTVNLPSVQRTYSHPLRSCPKDLPQSTTPPSATEDQEQLLFHPATIFTTLVYHNSRNSMHAQQRRSLLHDNSANSLWSARLSPEGPSTTTSSTSESEERADKYGCLAALTGANTSSFTCMAFYSSADSAFIQQLNRVDKAQGCRDTTQSALGSYSALRTIVRLNSSIMLELRSALRLSGTVTAWASFHHSSLTWY